MLKCAYTGIPRLHGQVINFGQGLITGITLLWPRRATAATTDKNPRGGIGMTDIIRTAKGAVIYGFIVI
jgi:hypothetical protein